MFLKRLEVQAMAAGLARHSAAAQSASARNIANSDTPGYRAARIRSFGEVWEGIGDAMRSTRPGHIGASRAATLRPQLSLLHDSPNKNSVSLEAEVMQSALNRQNHEMALGVSRSLSAVLRQTLSRR